MAADIVENAPLSIAVMKEELRILAGAHPMSPQGFERVQGLGRVCLRQRRLCRRHSRVQGETQTRLQRRVRRPSERCGRYARAGEARADMKAAQRDEFKSRRSNGRRVRVRRRKRSGSGSCVCVPLEPNPPRRWSPLARRVGPRRPAARQAKFSPDLQSKMPLS